MKGVILAGGLGTRLYPITLTINKHLLPIYDKPMIYYPIETLVKAGIKDILVIVSGPHAGQFLPILKNGEEFGCKITFAFQEKPDGGIADALALAKNFVGGDNVCVMLGDNTTDSDISEEVYEFDEMTEEEHGPCAFLFLKNVDNPSEFGIVKFDGSTIIEKIIEKPESPPSSCAVTGVYLYDSTVFTFITKCVPSGRGQLEITDVNNLYLERGTVGYSVLSGFWKDAGTFEALFQANKFWRNKANGENT